MSKGMTLIEIIIGIAIISFGVIFIVSVFPLGIRITDVNQKHNVALFLASGKIEEIMSQAYDEVEEGLFIEDFGEILGFEQYKRELEIKCFNPEGECFNEDTGIKEIKVTVFLMSVIERNISLTSLIVRK